MDSWEGAELLFYFNGQSYDVDLSDAQFAIISKILGLRFIPDGQGIEVQCFSDDALKKMTQMKGNPLHLKMVQKVSWNNDQSAE